MVEVDLRFADRRRTPSCRAIAGPNAGVERWRAQRPRGVCEILVLDHFSEYSWSDTARAAFPSYQPWHSCLPQELVCARALTSACHWNVVGF